MKDPTIHELTIYASVIGVSNFLLAFGLIFRTDDIIRAIKIKTNVPEYKHLPLGWRSVVGAILNMIGSALATNTSFIGAYFLYHEYFK